MGSERPAFDLVDVTMRFARRCSLSLWLLWHCVAAVAIVAISSQLRLGITLTASSPDHRVFLAQLVAAYLGCILLLAWRTRGGRTVPLVDVVLTVLAFMGGCALVLLVKQAYYSPFLLLVVAVVSGLSICVSFIASSRALSILAIGLAAITVPLQWLEARPKELLDLVLGNVPKPRKTQAVVSSLLYPLKATFYDNYFDVCDARTGRCNAPRVGGGLSAFSNGYLLATGEGLLHFFTIDPPNGALNARRLRPDVPLNSGAFLEQGPKDEVGGFRVMDILVREEGRRFTLFASHHHWKSDLRCFVVRISKLEGDTAAFLAGEIQGGWQTFYETSPCLPVKSGPRGKTFAGGESGGRMAFIDERTMLLTVGDHEFDGWNSTRMLAQEDGDYGKTLTIDLASGKAELYTRGHRNPQGLYIAPDKTIWSTEHGPSGGDELNILVKGRNYGWPLVTYGVDYLSNEWPLNNTPADHAGFQRPVFSWIPSIAISNVLGVQSKLFPLWKDDLLICTFSTSLLRTRVRDGRVAYVEHIEVRRRNGRLRDIMEDRDGRIVLWLDLGAVAILEPFDGSAEGRAEGADRGQALFSACAACHKLGDGTSHGIGPDLAGIVGRSVGGARAFGYSDGMKKQSGVWTDARLDEFLANPQKAVPGTSMQAAGIASEGDRASLIAYLKKAKPR